MTIRISVKPDEDGIIRFVHDGETIEIVLDPLSPPSCKPVAVGGTTKPTSGSPNPLTPQPGSPGPLESERRDPGEKSKGETTDTWDTPVPYFAPKEHSHDANQVMRELLRRFETQDKPTSLILQRDKIDLSTVVNIYRQIAEAHPNLPIGVDLSSALKR